MAASGYQPVYALKRGGQLESLHFGAIAVVSASGELLASYGDAQLSTFLRSAAKPFQALPFVLAGGVEHYGLSARELALICSSHSGTDEHVSTLAALQQKVGIRESQLQCGVHFPYHLATTERMKKAGQAATPNRNNCSGKHTAMLAYAKWRGWSLDSYLEPSHPLQREILALFAEFTGLPAEKLIVGTDGCSAPIWAAPIYNTALAYARLMDPAALPAALQRACAQVRAAMLAFPGMVAGPGRFDTELMQMAGGRILSKGGAEGFQALSLSAAAQPIASPAIGIALKIADGDARTWVGHAVAVEVLRQLGALSEQELADLAAFGPQRTITNWSGSPVGQGEPAFDLQI